MVLKKDDKENLLEPGASYYVLALNVGANRTISRVSYWVQRSAPVTPDAGPAPSPDLGPVVDPDGAAPPVNPTERIDTGSGGCSCRVDGLPAAGAWPALAALGLLLVLRRRRRD